MARRATLRASDSDREFVAERLRQAAAEGRILAEELEARLARALRARTYAELDPLVADLPATRGKTGRRLELAPIGAMVVAGAVAAVVVVAVVAVALLVITGLLFAWGFWIVLAWLFFGRGRRRGWYNGPPRRGGPNHQVRYAHRRTLL